MYQYVYTYMQSMYVGIVMDDDDDDRVGGFGYLC